MEPLLEGLLRSLGGFRGKLLRSLLRKDSAWKFPPNRRKIAAFSYRKVLNRRFCRRKIAEKSPENREEIAEKSLAILWAAEKKSQRFRVFKSQRFRDAKISTPQQLLPETSLRTPPRTSEISLNEFFQSGGWLENCLKIVRFRSRLRTSAAGRKSLRAKIFKTFVPATKPPDPRRVSEGFQKGIAVRFAMPISYTTSQNNELFLEGLHCLKLLVICDSRVESKIASAI